jgi:hypothetical protein
MTGARPSAKGEKPSLYADAVDAKQLAAAREMDGLDEEIAVLRVQFAELVRGGEETYTPMLRCAELIARTVAARHRMSPKRTDEFADSMAAVANALGGQMFPERFHDV